MSTDWTHGPSVPGSSPPATSRPPLLQGVEDKSHGRWKANALASTSAATVRSPCSASPSSPCSTARRSSELLPDPRSSSADASTTSIVLNLESLGSLPADEAGPLARYASTIQAQRHDDNGKVLSISAPRTSSRWRSSTT